MLYEMLTEQRQEILALCASKMVAVGESRVSSHEMELGLPVFYDELIEVLRLAERASPEAVDRFCGHLHRDSALRRGKESLKLGYTVSQVVHGYGAICQAITEYASKNLGTPIAPHEFNRLNFCLDVAIADAVTEYNVRANEGVARAEVQRLGFLAHELRNALANAATAHHMIKSGLVGAGGSTNQVLERALDRMKNIIDRSLAEVRLRGEPVIECEICYLVDMVGEVEATSMLEAEAKSIQLHTDIEPDLMVMADRHLVVSAISNLVQNAVKFTGENGNVWVRGSGSENLVSIEIEDECGGLPPGTPETLFQPYTQSHKDRSGLGLGLSISRRAIELNDGTISARDLPGKGCVFTIVLPRVTRSESLPQ